MSFWLPILLASNALVFSLTYEFFDARIANIQKDHAVQMQKQAEANEKAVLEVLKKEQEKTNKINEEKAKIRMDLDSARSDNRRMSKLLSRLSSDKDRETLIAERDRFAELATEANGLLIEIDEATRIINTQQ